MISEPPVEIPEAMFLLDLWKTDWFWGSLTQSQSGHIHSCWFQIPDHQPYQRDIVWALRSQFKDRLGISALWDVVVTHQRDNFRGLDLYRFGTKAPLTFTHSDIQKES